MVARLRGGVRAADVLSAIAVVAIWTYFLVFARMGVKKVFTPWDMAFLRFAFAGCAMLPVFLLRPAGQRLGALSLRQATILACFAGIGFSCFAYLGFSYAPAAHGAVLMTGALPFLTAIAAWIVLGEPVAGRKAWGLGLILLGIGFIGWYSLSGAISGAESSTWRGDILFPCAASCWAIFAVLLRRWKVSPVDATIASALIGSVIYIPVYLLFLPKRIMAAPLTDILLQGVYQGIIAMVVSMWLYTRVVQAFGATRTAMVTALCPGLAALSGIFMLGEPLSMPVLLGLASVTAGMIVGVTGQGAANESRPPPDAPSAVR